MIAVLQEVINKSKSITLPGHIILLKFVFILLFNDVYFGTIKKGEHSKYIPHAFTVHGGALIFETIRHLLYSNSILSITKWT